MTAVAGEQAPLGQPDKSNLAKHPIIPGQFRETNTIVGQNFPVATEDVQRCMVRWERAYTQLPPRLLPMAAAATPHRLLSILRCVVGAPV